MNRYTGPPSKANASTTCQKCLKKGHYSYECKTPAQSRPYASRPSRTQQLQNPKLKPALNSDTPNELLRKTGVADEQLAKAEEDRDRKRQRVGHDSSPRSLSSSSTSSLPDRRAPNPPEVLGERKDEFDGVKDKELSDEYRGEVLYVRDGQGETSSRRPRDRSRSTGRQRQPELSGERQRRGRQLRSRSRSPPRYRSRSHERGRAGLSRSPPNKQKFRERSLNRDMIPPPVSEKRTTARERSPSPYSKRLALTQAMNS